MAGATIWLLLVLAVVGYGTAGPLPEGKRMVVTTGPPDILSPLDQMMGDAPRSGQKPEIYSFNVYSDIQFRFARTLVTSKVINPADYNQELSFSVVLPENAFITGFLMESGNMTYRAYMTEKDTADAVYSGTVQSGKAGALLSFRDANLFDIDVNIEAYKQVSFKLSYEELLERKGGFYRHVVTVNTGQIVPGMKVKVHITEPRPITQIYTPKFSYNNLGIKACSGANMNATCVSDNEQVKKTSFSPNEVLLELGLTLAEQKDILRGTGRGLSGEFDVLYDVERDATGGEILVKDGYFIHLFAPPRSGTEYIPKHIVFVLDVSGSMKLDATGSIDYEKINQLKSAMKTILKDLNPEDKFNIITFANSVTTWGLDGSGDLVTEDDSGSPTGRYNDILSAFPLIAQINETAFDRINQMIANGGTNIFGGLRQGVRTAQKEQSDHPNSTKPIIFFLTDGDANTC